MLEATNTNTINLDELRSVYHRIDAINDPNQVELLLDHRDKALVRAVATTPTTIAEAKTLAGLALMAAKRSGLDELDEAEIALALTVCAFVVTQSAEVRT